VQEINVSRTGDPVHVGDKALTQETLSLGICICINTSKIPLAGFNSTGERAPIVGVGELSLHALSLRPAGSNEIHF
jgi:hypothetical protein